MITIRFEIRAALDRATHDCLKHRTDLFADKVSEIIMQYEDFKI